MSWDQLPIILPTVVAGIAVVGWTARGLRRMWHLMRKANRWLDQALGEPPGDGKPGRPSLMQRVEAIESSMADHLEWHADPGGAPAKPAVPTRPNGGTGRPRPR